MKQFISVKAKIMYNMYIQLAKIPRFFTNTSSIFVPLSFSVDVDSFHFQVHFCWNLSGLGRLAVEVFILSSSLSPLFTFFQFFIPLISSLYLPVLLSCSFIFRVLRENECQEICRCNYQNSCQSICKDKGLHIRQNAAHSSQCIYIWQ